MLHPPQFFMIFRPLFFRRNHCRRQLYNRHEKRWIGRRYEMGPRKREARKNGLAETMGRRPSLVQLARRPSASPLDEERKRKDRDRRPSSPGSPSSTPPATNLRHLPIHPSPFAPPRSSPSSFSRVASATAIFFSNNFFYFCNLRYGDLEGRIARHGFDGTGYTLHKGSETFS